MKTKLMFVFSVGLLTLTQNLTAQNNESGINQNNEKLNLIHYYDSELFHWSYNMYGGLILNYQNQNSGTSFDINETMKNALLSFPDSGQEYKSFRDKTITGNILMFSGLALVFGAFIPLFTPPINNSEDAVLRNSIISIALSGSGLIATIIGTNFFSSGQEHLFSAVSIYNRNKIREFK